MQKEKEELWCNPMPEQPPQETTTQDGVRAGGQRPLLLQAAAVPAVFSHSHHGNAPQHVYVCASLLSAAVFVTFSEIFFGNIEFFGGSTCHRARD